MEDSFTNFTHTDLQALKKHNLLRNIDLDNLERKTKVSITVDRSEDTRVDLNKKLLEKI